MGDRALAGPSDQGAGCGDLATCESLESGWTLYMFQSLEPREMGTSARGSPCVWLLSGLPSSFSPTARRCARPDRTSQSAYDPFLDPSHLILLGCPFPQHHRKALFYKGPYRVWLDNKVTLFTMMLL